LPNHTYVALPKDNPLTATLDGAVGIVRVGAPLAKDSIPKEQTITLEQFSHNLANQYKDVEKAHPALAVATRSMAIAEQSVATATRESPIDKVAGHIGSWADDAQRDSLRH
jgi:hypothetical protein